MSNESVTTIKKRFEKIIMDFFPDIDVGFLYRLRPDLHAVLLLEQTVRLSTHLYITSEQLESFYPPFLVWTIAGKVHSMKKTFK